MKQFRLVCTALAVVALGSWATQSFACDKDKVHASAANSGSSTTCTAAMAAQCTPAQAAACKAQMSATTASTASASSEKMSACCAGKAASAKTAAVTAANQGADHCSAAKSAAMFSTAGTGGSCSSAKSASAGASCGTQSSAMAADAGHCKGHGMMTTAAKSSHADCDACTDMSACSDRLDAAGAHRQMVRLKNGVMFVYTADSPGEINAVQAAVAQRASRIAQLASMGDKAHLCSECKLIRGAMASGKLNREIVNIEGGSLTLMTSSDPSVVAKLHELVNEVPSAKVASRIKS